MKRETGLEPATSVQPATALNAANKRVAERRVVTVDVPATEQLRGQMRAAAAEVFTFHDADVRDGDRARHGMAGVGESVGQQRTVGTSRDGVEDPVRYEPSRPAAGTPT